MQIWSLSWEDFPGVGNGNPLQYSCLENSIVKKSGRLQFIGSQRVGHDWAHMHSCMCVCMCVSHSVMPNSCDPMDWSPPGSSVHIYLRTEVYLTEQLKLWNSNNNTNVFLILSFNSHVGPMTHATLTQFLAWVQGVPHIISRTRLAWIPHVIWPPGQLWLHLSTGGSLLSSEPHCPAWNPLAGSHSVLQQPPQLWKYPSTFVLHPVSHTTAVGSSRLSKFGWVAGFWFYAQALWKVLTCPCSWSEAYLPSEHFFPEALGQ